MVWDDKVKKLKGILILILFLALLVSPIAVLASDVSGARYYGLIAVSNNGTAATNVATTCNISTANLISGGYLNASANNCAIQGSAGADLAFQPSVNSTYFWSLWVPSIGANGYLNDILYTANSTGGKIRYFPGAGGMTTADSATLELGDNFTVEQSGWVNTDNGTDKNLVIKDKAFKTAVSRVTDEEIFAVVIGEDKDNLDFKRPNLDWVQIPDDPAFSFTDGAGNDDPFSLVAWVNFDDATSSTIIAKLDPGLNQQEWTLKTDAGDLLEFYCSDLVGNKQLGRETAAVTGLEGSWAHIVATYDGSETLDSFNIYIDGVASDAANIVVGAYDGMGNGTEDVNIGSSTAGAADFMDGGVAEVRVYDVELTQAQVLDDYYGEPLSTNIVALWRIDEGAGNPQDTSGNGHNAIANTADWDTDFDNRFGLAVIATDVESGEHTIITTTDNTSLFFGIGKDIVDADFPINTNLVLNAPLWHTELDDAAFTTKDVNEYTATVTGATWSSDGYIFDGLTDDITLPLAMTPPYTITVWAKCDRLPSVRGLGSTLTDGQTVNKAAFSITGGDRIYFYNGADILYAVPDPTLTDWHMYTAVVNGGSSSVTVDDGTPATGTMTANTTTLIRLGENGNNTVWLEGLEGEVIYYNRALSSTEILANYNATKWKYETSDEYFHYNLLPAGVPNNNNNWTFLQNDVMPYMEYQTITIGGNLQQRIEWEYDTTFDDQSAGNHDATPTFRTASSDADVSAELVSFLPVSEARAPAFVLAEAPAFIESTPTVVSEFGVTPPAGTFPLAGVIRAVASATDTPAQLPLVLIAGFVIIGLSLAISGTMRKYGSGTVLVKVIVIAAIMGCFVAIGNFGIDFWMIVVFLIMGIALAMGSRQLGWQ